MEDNPSAWETVYWATDSRQGMSVFKDRRPEIVITDIRMPVMDGLDRAWMIRALAPKANVIVTMTHKDTAFFHDAIDVRKRPVRSVTCGPGPLFAAIRKCRIIPGMERTLTITE